MSYENPWTYDGKVFDSDAIHEYFGFVYCITNVPPNVNILEGNTSGPLENRQEKKEK